MNKKNIITKNKNLNLYFFLIKKCLDTATPNNKLADIEKSRKSNYFYFSFKTIKLAVLLKQDSSTRISHLPTHSDLTFPLKKRNHAFLITMKYMVLYTNYLL